MPTNNGWLHWHQILRVVTLWGLCHVTPIHRNLHMFQLYHSQLRLPSWRASNQSLSLGSGLLGTLCLSQEKGCSLLAFTPGEFFRDPTQWVYLYPRMPSACQVWGQIVAAWMGRETWFTKPHTEILNQPVPQIPVRSWSHMNSVLWRRIRWGDPTRVVGAQVSTWVRGPENQRQMYG